MRKTLRLYLLNGVLGESSARFSFESERIIEDGDTDITETFRLYKHKRSHIGCIVNMGKQLGAKIFTLDLVDGSSVRFVDMNGDSYGSVELRDKNVFDVLTRGIQLYDATLPVQDRTKKVRFVVESNAVDCQQWGQPATGLFGLDSVSESAPADKKVKVKKLTKKPAAAPKLMKKPSKA